MFRSILTISVLFTALVAAPALAAPPTATPVQHAEVGNSQIGYRDLNPTAGGRPLVLITGYATTMTELDPAFVEQLALSRRVITLDNRGTGNSTGPVKGLTIKKMAKDTIGLIDSLGIRRADFAGWSMGGYMAQQVAISAPEKVGKLVLLSSDPGSPQGLPSPKWVIKKLSGAKSPTELLPILFPSSKQAAGEAWIESIGKQPNLTAADFALPAKTMRQQTLAVGPRWYCKTCGTYGKLGQIKAKTLVAHGAEDVVAPPKNARLLAKRIKRSTMLRYRVAGHAFIFQAPRTKAERIGDFLDR